MSDDAKTARKVARMIATEHFGKEPMIAFPFENKCQELILDALSAVRAVAEIAEREACARVADEWARTSGEGSCSQGSGEQIAKAIRERRAAK